MRQTDPSSAVDRRGFLRSLAGAGGAALAVAYSGTGLASAAQLAGVGAASDLRDQIGLQLYTVRDLTAKDLPGTLLQVARIGYKEVQTTGSYGQYTAKQVREFLDRAGLAAPTTHVAPVLGPDFERTLEGYQLIGHRYTTVNLRGPAARPAAPGAPGAAPGAGAAKPAAPAQAPGGAGAAPVAGAAAPAAGGAAPARPAARGQTLDAAKRMAARLNEAGLAAKKYGIKVMIHNHTNEFAPLLDSSQRPYDVLLAETDPALVAMELDIGWAAAAGQNALEMFRASPGRYEVWHVKDMAQLASLNGLTDQAERQRAAKIVPVGEGDIDYRAIFAQAKLAGMKHFYVEQDSAPASGDSLAAAATSYRNLRKLLS